MDRETETSDRHQRILSAARETFSRCGFDQATMDDIAAKAEVSKGSIYCHFQDKEDLFASVVEDVVAGDLAIAASACAASAPAVLQLESLLDVLVRRIVTVCKRENLILELWAAGGRAGSKLRKSLVSAHRRWRCVIKKALDRGRDRGELDPDIDTEAATSLILAAINGAVVNLRLGDPEELARLHKMKHGLLLAASAW